MIRTISLALILFFSCNDGKNKNNQLPMDSKNTNCFNVLLQASDAFLIDQPAIIEFSITNNCDSLRSFCTYHTPFEGFMAPFFNIIYTETGEQAKYIGKKVKRPEPSENDFIELDPGETKSVKIDLNYGYELMNTGKYKILFCPMYDCNNIGCGNSTTFNLVEKTNLK